RGLSPWSLEGKPRGQAPWLAKHEIVDSMMIRSIILLAAICAPLRAAEPLPDGAIARLEKMRSALADGQITFTPDSQHIVAVSKGRVFVWEAATGKLLREFAGGSDVVLILAPLPDGTLFTLDSQGTAEWHDLRSGERIATRDFSRDLRSFRQFPLGYLRGRT